MTVGTLLSKSYSQETQKTSQVETKDKSNRALESEKQPGAETPSAAPSPASAPHIIPLAANNEGQRDSRKSEEEGTEFWPPLFGYRVKITDSLLALFTFLLFVATWLLWRATRNLVRGAEDTAERQLRAYVLVSGAQVMDIAIPDKCVVQLSIRNFGKTPAHDLICWMGTAVNQFPLPKSAIPSEPPKELRMGIDVIPPGGPVVNVVEVAPTNGQQEAVLQAGGDAIYAYGRAIYIDAFNKRRTTEFRYMCHGEGIATGRMVACEEGNRYT